MWNSRERLKEQLRACESGKFHLYSKSTSTGEKIDLMPEHIATIRRIIGEYDELIDTYGAPEA
jgi:hypothetical protein